MTRHMHKSMVSAVALAAVLAAGMAGTAAQAADTEAQGQAKERMAQDVAAAVKAQVAKPLSGEDRDRQRLLTGLLGERTRARSDIKGRTVQPLTRRGAAMMALDRNLTIAIARNNPERFKALLNEAQAVFDPVFDLSLSYGRQDTYKRSQIGTVRPKVFTPQGNASVEYDTSVSSSQRYCTLQCRQDLTKLVAPPDKGQPRVLAYEFYENTSSDPKQMEIQASKGRDFGSPKEQWTLSMGVSQLLPWGGTLTLTDQTVMQEVYYRTGYYWEGGQFTTNVTGALNTPLPFAKGFGKGNAYDGAIRKAEVAADIADWQVKAAVNQVLLNTDVAFFELVRSLEALRATVGNRDLVKALQGRIKRLGEAQLATNYQEAQMSAEAAKADLQVEQALEAYLSASVRLSGLIGVPENFSGANLYLPYGYAGDLSRPGAVNKLDKALEIAKQNRPDITIANRNKDTAGISLEMAENAARPDVTFSGSIYSGQNGSVYGYRNPIQSTYKMLEPDNLNKTMALNYTHPWKNRAAEARVEAARIALEDSEVAIQSTGNSVQQEITTRLAGIQTARANIRARQDEAKRMRTAYDSMERSVETGLVSDDQRINALRQLLSAEVAAASAAVDAKQAESGLLFSQGIIANALPGQTSEGAFDKRRLAALNATGKLAVFAPAKGAAAR